MMRHHFLNYRSTLKNDCFLPLKADFTLMAMNEWKFTLLIYGLCMFSEGRNINHNQLLWLQRSLSSLRFWISTLCKALYPVLACKSNIETGSRLSPGIFLRARVHTPSSHWCSPGNPLCLQRQTSLLLWSCYWNKDFLKYSLSVISMFMNLGRPSFALSCIHFITNHPKIKRGLNIIQTV